MNVKLKKLKEDGIFFDSITENNAIALLDEIKFKTMKSIGISTAGYIEAYYATQGKNVVATTLDDDGIKYMKNIFKDIEECKKNIEYRIEDASKPSPDKDEQYDIIYSRLALHYLEKKGFETALKDCYRVLKPGGIFFIVVKSINDFVAQNENAKLDEKTGMTESTEIKLYGSQKRKYYSVDSLSDEIKKAGFIIQDICELSERLCKDFYRQVVENFAESKVIQCICIKPDLQ